MNCRVYLHASLRHIHSTGLNLPFSLPLFAMIPQLYLRIQMEVSAANEEAEVNRY